MNWSELAGWWRSELVDDPAYEADITPLILDLLEPSPGARILDVGCGEGRLMKVLAAGSAAPYGVDISIDLLDSARMFGPVLRAELPDFGSIRSGCFDAAVVALVLEHLEDEWRFFAELGRVVRPGGRLALVMNHPIFTAPESAPIDESDEVLWRSGRYFGRGFTDEKAGDGSVRFYHRTTATLMNAASGGGWDLDTLVELGATESQVQRHRPLERQAHIPRLLGAAWNRRSVGSS